MFTGQLYSVRLAMETQAWASSVMMRFGDCAAAGQESVQASRQSRTAERTIRPSMRRLLGSFSVGRMGLHAERLHVDLQQALLLGQLGAIHLPQPDDLPQNLGIEAMRLGLGIDFLDVIGERLLLLLQPLDARDDLVELVGGEIAGDQFGGHGGKNLGNWNTGCRRGLYWRTRSYQWPPVTYPQE